MKVGFVLSQPFGYSIGTDVRIRGLLKGLNSYGVEIHVITPFREKNISIDGRIIPVHRISSLANLKISNMIFEITRSLTNKPFLFKKLIGRKSLLLRSAYSLSKDICKIVKKLNLDVLQAEQQIASMACIKAREKLSVPVVTDFHGVWAEEMVASNIINYNDKCYQTLFELEHEIACSADAVTVVSEEMKDYVTRSYGVSSNRVCLVPNATFLRADRAKNVKNPTRVIHSGTLHSWENVELFVESMPFVLKHYPSARFYLTRKGPKLKKVMKIARSLGISPEFVWFNDEGDFFEFLKSCDIGVISSTNHIARRMAYPAKLYDYLSVGLPIVANNVGAWARIIRENKVGIVTEDTAEAFAEGILELLMDPELLYKCGQHAIDLVKNELNYYKSAERLLNVYKRLVK